MEGAGGGRVVGRGMKGEVEGPGADPLMISNLGLCLEKVVRE